MQDVVNELNRQIEDMAGMIRNYDTAVRTLRTENSELKAKITRGAMKRRKLRNEVYDLLTEVDALQDQVLDCCGGNE